MLDAAFLARLEALGLRSRMRASGGAQGAQRSFRRGQSLEFADHRDYVPGDDLRHLDWQILARLDRLFLKLFEAREDRTVHVLLDRSLSMAGPKWDAARKAAAAVAYASLCGLDRVQLFACDSRPLAEGRPLRGRGAVHRLFRFLQGARSDGVTDLGAVVAALPPPRAGTISVLISDLYCPGELDDPLRRLRHRGGELHVLHVVDPRELAAEGLTGDLTLVDAETGAELPVTLDRPAREAYRAAVEAWLAAARESCRRRGIGYTTLDASADVEAALLRWLRVAAQ
jgi:uncharacterized protein (DUF58 family)